MDSFWTFYLSIGVLEENTSSGDGPQDENYEEKPDATIHNSVSIMLLLPFHDASNKEQLNYLCA